MLTNRAPRLSGPSAPISTDRPPQRLTDLRGLAEFLGLELRTVANPAWRERLGTPFYQINPRCIRFDLEEVAAHLLTHCHYKQQKEVANASQ